MPTDRAHTIYEILAAYVEAKLDVAALELLQAKRWIELERNPYTEGKLLWASHQYAALKIVNRDVIYWKSVIKKYQQKLKKRAKDHARTKGSVAVESGEIAGDNAIQGDRSRTGMGSSRAETNFVLGE
jgi:hypothetical protein